jgi:hypothetical protein
MKKIPTLFIREGMHVTEKVTSGCEWVMGGEGFPTYKWDGTCVLIKDDNTMWKRRQVKPDKPDPEGFELCEEDPNTGKRFGWMSCDRDNPDDEWHWEGFDSYDCDWIPGTYELVGPKVQGNPHGFRSHALVLHGKDAVEGLDLSSYQRLRVSLDAHTGIKDDGFEGVVWYHPDGRMCKLKTKDFQ